MSSYYYSGKAYPQRVFVERAIAAIEKELKNAKHTGSSEGKNGGRRSARPPTDAKDLRKILQGLRYYLHLDYK